MGIQQRTSLDFQSRSQPNHQQSTAEIYFCIKLR
ncbi:hypothetical protein T11_4598 [Trichinella zimbabwensis]|uniref:Uncharacterized protein n=1 Tax=Trichinella zimbabwensis TaxID=268475 RepID=A0A0V1G925_9BILA|nr:hypothetical protein T11_4598 [Trichinella zimbabwensis]